MKAFNIFTNFTRGISLLIILLAGLTACQRKAPQDTGQEVAQQQSAETAVSGKTRTVMDANGAVEIPVNPKRIVAPRGDSITTPLLDLDAPIAAVGGRVHSLTNQRFIRGATPILGVTFENTDLIDLGDPNDPDFERILGAKPDLIIINTWQAKALGQYQNIAPTVVVPAGLTMLEQIAFLADVAGVKGSYDQELEKYRAKITLIKEILGDPSKVTISRFDMRNGEIWHYLNWGAVAQVIRDVGFSRPQILVNQQEINAKYSGEKVMDFDADIMITSYARHFAGQTVDGLKEDWDKTVPYWREIPAVKRGDHYWYPRDIWVGYTFTSLNVVADSLLLLTTGRSGGGN